MNQNRKLRSRRLAQIQQKRTPAQLIQLLHPRAMDTRFLCDFHFPAVQSADCERRQLEHYKRNKYPRACNFEAE